MAIPPLPPLRIREADGSPNVIPVFEIVVSNNTLENLGGGKVSIGVPSGGSGATTANSFITWQAEVGLSAEKVLTAGSSVVIHTDATAIYIDALTGGGAGTVYSATGNSYVLIANAADLTADRALTANLGIAIVDSGANAAVYLQVATPFVVTSNRTINTTAPVAGGGNLSADRTFTVDTLCLITSGRTISTTEPVRGGGDLSANRTISIAAASATSAGALSSADWVTFNAKQPTITWPLITGSGGTGLATVGSGGMVLGVSTGGSTLEYKVLAAGNNITITHAGSTMTIAADTGGGAGPTYAATGNQYVLIANAADLTADRALAAGTGLVLVDGGANSSVTLAMSSRLVEIPLAPIMVNTGNANVFWASKPRTSYYDAVWTFADGVVGTMTWAGHIPARLWGTPAWNLVITSEADAGNGGNVMLSFRARDYANADSNTLALTTLVQSATYAILSAPILSIQAATASNFDAAEALSGGCRLVVEVLRHGDAANDTLGQGWNLLGLSLRTLVP